MGSRPVTPSIDCLTWILRKTNMKTTIAFSLAATCLVLMPSVHSASFDCAKAKTKVDKLVCGDPKLSDLDEKLIALYNKVLALSPVPEIVLPSSPAEDRDAAGKIGPAIVKKEPLELIGRVSEGHDVAGANFAITSGKRYYVIRYTWDLTDEQKETLNKIEDPNQYVLLKAQLVTYKDGSKGIDRDSIVEIFGQSP